MKKNYKVLTLDGLFEGGRMFVGATSMAYLLSVGVTVEKIGILKIIQAMVFIFAELPTGIIGDIYGRKFSLTASLVLGSAGFGAYFMGNNIFIFSIAEILVALSLCFWSGAYEAFCIDFLDIENDSTGLDKFFHLNSTVNKIATVLFGAIGGYIALNGYSYPYLGAFFVYIITVIFLITSFKEMKGIERAGTEKLGFRYHFLENIKVTFKEGLLNPLLIEFFVFQILLQAAIQPLLHYWQPYFLSVDEGLSSSALGQIFTIYVVSSALLSAFYAKLSEFKFYKNIYFQAIPLIIFGLSFYLIGKAGSLVMGIIFFSLSQAFLGVIFSIFSSRFNEQIPSKNRAGVLSSMSLFSRFGSMISLGIISLYTFDGENRLTQIQNIFKYSSLIYMTICVILVGTILVIKKKRR